MYYTSMEKIILTDCDGVLLNWEYAFGIWMEEQGYHSVEMGNFIYNIGQRYNISNEEGKKLIKLFNESANIGFLPALRDAEHYVKLLGNLGYRFHIISSLSKNVNAQKLRVKNLEKLFGPVFDKHIYLDTGEDKDHVLATYQGTDCYWIEDKPENALVGIQFGLKSLLMEHAFNLHFADSITTVKNWKEIYHIVEKH